MPKNIERSEFNALVKRIDNLVKDINKVSISNTGHIKDADKRLDVQHNKLVKRIDSLVKEINKVNASGAKSVESRVNDLNKAQNKLDSAFYKLEARLKRVESSSGGGSSAGLDARSEKDVMKLVDKALAKFDKKRR